MLRSALAGAGAIASVEAGIDWVTFTAGEGDDWEGLGRLGRGIVDQQAARGAKVSLVPFQGYRGWGTDGCAYGFRNQAAYLRLSGSMASCFWREVSGFTGHPTRLDVQTTITLTAPDKSFGGRWWREQQGKQFRHHHRPPKRTYSVDNRGLWIGTVGTRISRAFVRIYDKGVEASTHPAGERWRFELEAKRDLSRSLWRSLTASQDVTPWCLQTCRAAAFGAACRWPIADSALRTALPPVPERRPPSVESALKWLRESVAPSVERLLVDVSVDELLETLGLDGYAQSFTSNTKVV